MLIEGAFLMLPEFLLGHAFPSAQYESTLTSHLAMGVLLELSARNIAQPMHRVHMERPYPDDCLRKAPGRADLFVDLGGVHGNGPWHSLYGMKSKNWCETKFFGGIGRERGHPVKTEHAGSVAWDLYRLCLFVREERSRARSNGRYLILVFNRVPSQYLAFTHPASSSRRTWLEQLTTPGEHRVSLAFSHEPSSFFIRFPKAFKALAKDASLDLRVIVRSFEPVERSTEHLYWGYLVRIVDFTAASRDLKLSYRDASEETWTEAQQAAQTELIRQSCGLKGSPPRAAE